MFRPLQVNKMGCFAFFKTIDLIFMLRKSILFYILTVSFIVPVFAQNYITSLGVRVADNTDFRMAGLSLQQRIFKKTTLEAVIQSDFQKNTTFHLLGEYHQNIITKGFNFYLGAGAYTGFEESLETDQQTPVKTQNSTFGADLIAGVELTMLHWNLSLDYKPTFNIAGRDSWYQSQVGISVRAVLLNDATLRKHKREKEREKRKKERINEREKRQQERANNPVLEDIFKDIFKKKGDN